MYSYEDRVRAVALYIKLGKRPKATIRQLGLSKQECFEGLVPGI
jgi:putative transposase